MRINNMAIMRGHLRNAVLETPDIPDDRLMIADAEERDSVLLRIPQTKIPASVAKTVKKLNDTMDNATLMQAVADNQIEVNDISTNIALLNSKLGVY